MNKKRYEKLDVLRGFALLNMIAYHAIWDLVYMYGYDWTWYKSYGAYIWQQGICWTFIFLSGFCVSLGRHALKRGITVFVGGALITAVTLIVMPQNRVIFGVLTLIGSSMIITYLLEKIFLKKVPSLAGMVCSVTAFVITRNVNMGYLGFENHNILKLPDIFYKDVFTTYIGFPYNDFYSTDYFALIPWYFLFMTGYFAYKYSKDSKFMDYMQNSAKLFKPLKWLGKHSFEIYLIHQPVIYFVLELCC